MTSPRTKILKIVSVNVKLLPFIYNVVNIEVIQPERKVACQEFTSSYFLLCFEAVPNGYNKYSWSAIYNPQTDVSRLLTQGVVYFHCRISTFCVNEL